MSSALSLLWVSDSLAAEAAVSAGGSVMATSLPPYADPHALAEAIAQLCEDPHPYRDGWRARCPNHQGKSDTSFSITPADDRVLIT